MSFQKHNTAKKFEILIKFVKKICQKHRQKNTVSFALTPISNHCQWVSGNTILQQNRNISHFRGSEVQGDRKCGTGSGRPEVGVEFKWIAQYCNKIKILVKLLSQPLYLYLNHRTRGIISRDLYIFYLIFHCGLYCRGLIVQTILVLNKEFFQFLNLKSAVCYQERFKIKSRY